MRAVLACFTVVSLVACGGKGGGSVAKPKGPVGPAIPATEAKQGASDLITEIYETLGRGNKDSLFTLLDDSLIVFGPRRADMLGTRADALVALEQVVDAKSKKQLKIQSGKLEVLAAPGGRSALAIDTASLNGQPHTVLAVLTNVSDLWLVEAVAVAQTPTEQVLKAELAKDAVVPPGAAGAKKIDPSAQGAVDKFQRGLLDQAGWGAELGSRTDAVVIGPTAGEVTRGKQDIKAMWKKRVDAKTRAAISGEITAAVTDDGQLAWVSAPITRVEGDGSQPLPLRAFAVYTNEGGDWKLLALHESLALGEPGSGASFKKILPPMPVEEKPPEIIAAKPADKGEPAKADRPGKKKLRKAKLRDKDQDQAEGGDETPKKKKLAKLDDEAKGEAKAEAKAEDESPRRKKKKKRSFTRNDDEDEAPKKSRSKSADSEEETPKKKSKKAEAEASEEAPRKKKSKAKVAEAEVEAEAVSSEEAPKKKRKKKSKAKVAEAEAEAEAVSSEEAPKKKSKAKVAEAAAEPEAEAEAPKKKKSKAKAAEAEAEAEPEVAAPKKKKKSAPADDDEIEVID